MKTSFVNAHQAKLALVTMNVILLLRIAKVVGAIRL